MKLSVLSVKTMEFPDKQTGERRVMWQVYCKDSTGGVGSLFSTQQCADGDQVEVELLANRDGKLMPKIVMVYSHGTASKGNDSAVQKK